MRVRKTDANSDAIFGGGQSSFWVDQPEAVAQVIKQRLLLLTSEWFLDVTDGTPWSSAVLGTNTTSTYDAVIRARILGTQGCNAMLSYSSTRVGRILTIQAQVDTIYGPVAVAATL